MSLYLLALKKKKKKRFRDHTWDFQLKNSEKAGSNLVGSAHLSSQDQWGLDRVLTCLGTVISLQADVELQKVADCSLACCHLQQLGPFGCTFRSFLQKLDFQFLGCLRLHEPWSSCVCSHHLLHPSYISHSMCVHKGKGRDLQEWVASSESQYHCCS